jgi:hypothetical protein
MAAERTFATLLDYADLSNPYIGAMRTIFPFAQYLAKTPLSLAQMAAAQPGRMAAVAKAEEAIVGPQTEGPYTPPPQVTRVGDGRIARPEFQDFAQRFLGVGEIPPGSRIAVRTRNPAAEVPATLLGLLGPNRGDVLMSQFDPGSSVVAEAITGRDPATGQDRDESFIDIARRRLPPFLPGVGAPPVIQLINEVMAERNRDPYASMNVLGFSKQNESLPDDLVRQLQRANTVSPFYMHVVDAGNPWRMWKQSQAKKEWERKVGNLERGERQNLDPVPILK